MGNFYKEVFYLKVGIYDIINNPLPELLLEREITVKKNDFETYEDIVNLMNKELKMDKLHSEHMYVLALTRSNEPKGILLCSVGDSEEFIFNSRALATGLLLLGAEQFMVFHNHPGYSKKVSDEDKAITTDMENIGKLLQIDFIDHLMITKGYYESCKNVCNDEAVYDVDVVDDILNEWKNGEVF